MKTVALFDIADQAFTFYTDAEWAKELSDWRQQLAEDGMEVKDMSTDDVVEAIGGEEYFWDNIA